MSTQEHIVIELVLVFYVRRHNMDTLLDILSPHGIESLESLIIAILIAFLIVKELYGAVKWIQARFDGYHEEKNKIEDHEENIDSRIVRLEKHDSWQYNQLCDLKLQMSELSDLIKQNHKDLLIQLAEIDNCNKEIAVASLRDVINRIHRSAMSHKSISHQDLLTFTEAVRIYRQAGGDGMVDEKLYPEVMALPISDGIELPREEGLQ